MSAQPRYQYHLHGTLVAYILVTLLIAAGAFNSNNNLLFFLFGLAIALLLIGGVHSGSVLMRVRVERAGAWAEPAGGAVRLRYRLRHTGGRLTGYALKVLEEPAAAGKMLDRPAHAFGAFVRPRGEAEIEAATRSTRRGELTLGPVRLLSEFPFGLVRKSVVFDLPARVVVHPAEVPVPEVARRAIGRSGRGEDERRDADPRFAGEEFYGLREYAEGDSPRAIAWRASARRGADRPWLVRQNAGQPVPEVRIMVALDLLGAGDEAAYEYAVSEAGAIVRLADRAGVPVGLEVAGMGVSTATASGHRHAVALLDDLAMLPTLAVARSRSVLPTVPAATENGVVRLVVKPGRPAAREGHGVAAGVGPWAAVATGRAGR